MTSKNILRARFTIALLVTLFVKPALAACGGPPTAATSMGAVGGFTSGAYNGNPGDTVYDATNQTLAICNGTSWVDLANASGNFVNLQATTPGTQQTGNMNVSGSGIFGTSLTTPLIYPSANSTTAIQFDKANGSTNVVDIDTTNGRVGIGTTAPAYEFEVNGSSATGALAGITGTAYYDGLKVIATLNQTGSLFGTISQPKYTSAGVTEVTSIYAAVPVASGSGSSATVGGIYIDNISGGTSSNMALARISQT